MYRFYDPQSGRIFIDDQDIIKDVQMESLRKAIGVVPQDTPLFHADVLHNVRYGNLEATDEEVMEAAKRANVHDTVQRLPHGYKTQVGERGLMISGGEKQRLAVARVLLKDPPILFFDEAVSQHMRKKCWLTSGADFGVGCAYRTRVDEEHQQLTIIESTYKYLHCPSATYRCGSW